MSVLEPLIRDLGATCAGLPDRRKQPPGGFAYTMSDIGLSAFSVFFMGSASFLAHQRRLDEGHGRSNCQTLFGISKIPTDAHIRDMLDGAPPEAFDPPPRVDSAIVRMLPLKTPPPLDPKLLGELVASAFSQRRKLLRHSLGRWLEARGFQGQFDLQRRAEEVPVEEFVALAQSL